MNTTTTEVPDIAVIIPHYNDLTRLKRCLDALMKNDIGTAEILVIDNNSPTPLDTLHDVFPQVRFLCEREKGAGPARNLGVKHSRADILAFLDADCVPSTNWLSTIRASAPEADLVGGRIIVFDETPGPRSGAEAFENVFAFDQKRYVQKKGFSVTANLLTSRHVYTDTGAFKNGVSEDYDWCHRACAKGYRLTYNSNMIVAHPSRATWADLRKKWKRLTQESFALWQMSSPGISGRLHWGLKSFFLPVSIFLHVPNILLSSELSSIGEKKRAIQTLIQLRFTRMLWMQKQALFKKI